MMSKCIFQAGFNWKVVENKWDDIEDVFDGFDIGRMGFMTDEEIGEHLSNPRVIRHGKKIAAIRDNAQFLGELAHESGSAANVFASGLRATKSDCLPCSRNALRGWAETAPFISCASWASTALCCHGMFARALVREGVVDKSPSSKKDMEKVQAAFNEWSDQSGRPLMQISRILACSIDG